MDPNSNRDNIKLPIIPVTRKQCFDGAMWVTFKSIINIHQGRVAETHTLPMFYCCEYREVYTYDKKKYVKNVLQRFLSFASNARDV